MSFFIYNDNELENIVLHPDYLEIISENEYFDDDGEQEPEFLEWLLPEPPDIYKDDHPWDTRVNRYRFRPDIFMMDQNLIYDYNI